MHEYDREVVVDILDDMLWALDQIQKRFKKIETASDFLDSDLGLEKLDSICMQLINIGEALKRIDKVTHKKILNQYPQIGWNMFITEFELII